MKKLFPIFIVITTSFAMHNVSAMKLRSGKVTGNSQENIIADEIIAVAEFTLNEEGTAKLRDAAPEYLTYLKRLPIEIRERMFFFAAEYNLKSALRMLLAAGVYVNATNKDGESALHIAAFYNYHDIITILISHHARINARDNNGHTVFMFAASQGHSNLAAYFLDPIFSTNINARDFEGCTALHYVAKTGNLPVVMILATHGASVLAQDYHGNTPLSLARAAHDNNCQVRRYIEERAQIETKAEEERKANQFFFDRQGTVGQ